MNTSKLVTVLCTAILGVVATLVATLIMIIPNLSDAQGDTLIFTSESLETVYDGSLLVGGEWELTSGKLKDGHTAEVKVVGSQRYVGTTENFMSVKIVDTFGADVTSEYNVKCVPGTLTVTPVTITVTSDSAKKKYDGLPLTADGYSVTPEFSMPPNHEMSVEITGTITEIGEARNTVSSVKITNSAGKDLSFNFNILVAEGKLIVTDWNEETDTNDGGGYNVDTNGDGMPDLNLDTDGDRVPDTNLDIDGDGLADLNIDVNGDFIPDTNIDGDGDRVPEMNLDFDGDGIPGSFGDLDDLENLNKDIDFDGAPDLNVDMNGDGLADLNIDKNGDLIPDLNIDINGDFVPDVNIDTNRDGEPDVNVDTDGDGIPNINLDINSDKIADMNIDKNGDGVPDKNLGLDDITGNGPGGIDTSGNIGLGNGMTDMEQLSKIVCYVLTSDTSGKIYLKIANQGNYNGRGWSVATPYTKYIDSVYSASYLTSLAMQGSGAPLAHVDIEIKNGQLVLPYYAATNGSGIVQKNDTYVSGIDGTSVSFDYYYGSTSGISVPIAYAGFESMYRDFVYSNYLDIDGETLAYMQAVIASNGFYASDPDILNRVSTYISGAAEYNMKYDRTLDESGNIVVAFLRDYKEGICQHYASAATLLLRALGIPARYTVGFVADVVGNAPTNVGADRAHAWVEAYVDGAGWIALEVTGGSSGMGGVGNNGSIGGGSDSDVESDKKLTLKPKTAEKLYDGTPLYPTNEIVSDPRIEKWINLGYRFEVTITGDARTEPGKSYSSISSYAILDPDGNDVTGEFDIKLSVGVIHVYIDIFNFSSCGREMEYDGTLLVGSTDDVSFDSNNLPSGFSYEVSVRSTSGIKNVGSSTNDFVVRIYDEFGTDVSDNYKLDYNYGTFKVTAREITVTAGSKSMAYSGEALTCDEADITAGSLADGDIIKGYLIVGSQTQIGRSKNKVSDVIIVDSEGNDVTANYVIVTVDGVLTVYFQK